MSFEVALLLGLFIKHFICDFPLQATPWMYKNKGTILWCKGSFISWIPYPHPGGLAHAFLHAAGTGIVVVMTLIFYDYPPISAQALAMSAAMFDYAAHYIIDFSKVNTTQYFELKPDNSEWFWILLGLDQLLHALTYFAITYAMPLVQIHCRGL